MTVVGVAWAVELLANGAGPSPDWREPSSKAAILHTLNVMPAFTASEASAETYFRSVILFGRNVASYKFALGEALLQLAGEGRTFVTLEELARPFSASLLRHLRQVDMQGTSGRSQFLDLCRSALRGELNEDALITGTVKLGFTNVIDAFHIVNQGETPVRFFVDERRSRRGILLTEALLALPEARSLQFGNLPQEVEARWRLVEEAWSLHLPASALTVQVDDAHGTLYLYDRAHRRRSLTGVREALNGYQKGQCFYCHQELGLATDGWSRAEVDHFFPHVLKTLGSQIPVDGIWNLVLACQRCNRGEAGKMARVPAQELVERLHTRNTFLIQSHHPLRETLLNQMGMADAERAGFIRAAERQAVEMLIHRWRPPHVQAFIA